MSVITINDPTGVASADIHAGLGFNCFRFDLQVDGNPLEILWAAEDFVAGTASPSGSGIPILFPFPGRLPGTVLQWDGRDYPLPAGDNMGNAIHGFVHERPWRVTDQQPGSVTGQFQASIDEPSLLDQWPGDFRIELTYRVSASSLVMDFLVENPGETPLPCGLGSHAYFRLPLGGGQAEECRVAFPVSERWEMEAMIATGTRNPLGEFENFTSGMTFGAMTLDDVFSGVQFDNGIAEASILDPLSGRRLLLRWDENFPHCVVYTPPHREAICIEPYTLVPGGWSFQPAGAGSGLRVLEPGESFQAWTEIAVE
ncbi:MAG: aldose 1-epimerase [Planctomycetota bacterium]|nr:aldose 1-epimerase [Planctomycetota bacterium]